MSNLLVIGDPHAHPDYDNKRFTDLGRFIVKSRPDIVVCIGDMADMPSLSMYDKVLKDLKARGIRRMWPLLLTHRRRCLRPLERREDTSLSST